jgi:hypothetical protein
MKKHLGIAGLVIVALAFAGVLAHWHQTLQRKRAAGEPDTLVVRGRTSEGGVSPRQRSDRPAEALPEHELRLLTGSGGLDSASYFSCWITNASRWTVSDLFFQIRAVETHGMERWERRYRESIRLPPRTKAQIHFKVSEGGAGAIAEWEIVAGRGHPPD